MKTIRVILLLFLTLGTLVSLAQDNKKIQVALLLDTSNSMDGLIDQAKSQLWKIVNELSAARFDGIEPDLNIALYEYGNDALSVTSGYIRMVLPLSTDLDKLSGELFGLKTNGGSEYCGHVIQTATQRLSWSTGEYDLHVIYIAGNEEFTQGSVDYVEAVAGAKAKDIVVNTIFCGPWQEGERLKWKDAAIRSGGDYMNIDQDKKTVYVASPYDDDILKLNERLNKTYKEYGKEGKERMEYQKKQDVNAASYSKSNMVNRALSKSKKAYKNESWDLVDAYDAEEEFVEKAKVDNLPEEYKGLSKKDLESKILELKAERESIKNEIAALEIKRNTHVANEKKKMISEGDESLDAVMLKSVRKQAVKKNYKFK